MIDIEQFITDHAEDTLEQLIDAIYSLTNHDGEAKQYNYAVRGPDVKDSIVKLSLLIRGMLDKANDDISAVSKEREFIDAFDAVINIDDNDVKFDGDVYANGDEKLATENIMNVGLAQKLGFVRQLTSSHDMDDVIDTGHYIYNASSQPANKPSINPCSIIVWTNPEHNYVAQLAVNILGNMYYRGGKKESGTVNFTEWKTVYSKAEADAAITNKLGYVRQLTSDDDMNNVIDSGLYIYNASDRPSNRPSINPCSIFVCGNPSHNYVAQLAVNILGNMYYRGGQKVEGTVNFTEWKIVYSKAEADAAIGLLDARVDALEDNTQVSGTGGMGCYVRGDAVTENGTLIGYHDAPQNGGVLNAWRKAKQMLEIEWTNTAALPSYNGDADRTVAAGTHDGIPYSSVKEINTYVPQDVSIRTFMTALTNPYSMIYTETVNGAHERSAYGFDYNGTDYCGIYYGATCSTFIRYVLGMESGWDTAQFAYLARQGVFSKIPDQSASGVQLFDIIWTPGHGEIIIDIIRDAMGRPVRITVAEATTKFVQIETVSGRKYYSFAEFNAKLKSKTTILYRYNRIESNNQYDYTPYVTVPYDEDEAGYMPTPPAANADICTFAGDYAAFRNADFPIHINYTKGSYSTMVIKRGDTVVDSVTLPDNYNDTHSINVTSLCSVAGKYTAHLTDGIDDSEPTHFEVIDTSTSVSTSGSNVTVTFAANSNPRSIEVIRANGAKRVVYEISVAERAAGQATFDPTALETAQTGSVASGAKYVRVIYGGEYGRVINKPISI